MCVEWRFVKIANSAILLQHLLMSTEALKKKCTPAEIHTMGFLKKREIIPLNHFIQWSLDFSLKCLNRQKFSYIRQNHFFSSNHSNIISRSMITWRKIDLCTLSEIWFLCSRCGFRHVFSQPIRNQKLLEFKTKVFFKYVDLLLFVFKHYFRECSFPIGQFKAVQRRMASISRNEQGDYLILIMSSVPK